MAIRRRGISSLVSSDLDDLDGRDLPRVEVDALLERARKAAAVARDDPAFFDDPVLDDAPADERRAQDRGVLALGHAAADEHLAPLLRERFREPVARWGLRVHRPHDMRADAGV